jgi:hypothetical protein
MAKNPISNAARTAAEKLIQTKYRNAGLYATDKARGENRSVLSAAQHAKSSEKNAMRPTKPAEINRAQTDTIQKRSVQTVPSRTAPKTGLENRGNKITTESQKSAAVKITNDKFGKFADQRFDTMAGGPRAGETGNRGASPKKIVQNKAIARAADKQPPVQIRSSGSLSQSGRLGGAHAGGHGISEEEMFAGKTPSKLGGMSELGARIVRATEGEVPLP